MDWLVSSPRAISPSAPGANGAIGSTWSPLYVGSVTLLAGVVVDLTLPKMIEILSAGKGTLEDLTRLGHHSMGDDPRGPDVGEALDAGLELLRAEVLESSTEDDAPGPSDPEELEAGHRGAAGAGGTAGPRGATGFHRGGSPRSTTNAATGLYKDSPRRPDSRLRR